jgi:hypothetical protein
MVVALAFTSFLFISFFFVKYLKNKNKIKPFTEKEKKEKSLDDELSKKLDLEVKQNKIADEENVRVSAVVKVKRKPKVLYKYTFYPSHDPEEFDLYEDMRIDKKINLMSIYDEEKSLEEVKDSQIHHNTTSTP